MAASSMAPTLFGASTGVRQLRGLALAALWVFTFTVPSSSSLVFADSVGTISRLVGGLAMAIGVAALLAGGRWYRLIEPHVLMILFVGWSYVSILWTIAPGLTEIARWTAIQLLVLVLLVWEFARAQRQWRSLLWAYALGAAASGLGIYYAALSGAAWGSGRFTAAGFNPGSQAQVLRPAIPLAIYLAYTSQHRAARVAAWSFVPLVVGAVLLTASRASLLILPVALAAVPMGRLARARERGVAAPPVVPMIVGIVAVVGLLMAVLPAETSQRLWSIETELTEGDLSGRAPLWEASVDAVGEHELLGVGAGASRRILQATVGELQGAHNAFLTVASELGMVGLLLVALMLVAVGYRASRHTGSERVLALTTFAVAVLGMVPSHSLSEKATWLALAFVLAPTPDELERRTSRGRILAGARPTPPTGAST